MTRERGIWRGFLVGLILLPLNTLWVFYLESIGGYGPYVSTISLFFNVVFIVVFLALANAVVRRLRPGLALNRGELIIVYVMLTISTSIAGHDMLQVLIPMMTTGYWFATPQNRWEEMLNGGTPSWLVISDRDVLYGYWNGTTTLYQAEVLRAWIVPVLWWTGFTVVLVFVLMCLAVVLRPLWADRERLTFPIIQLPLELTNPDTPLLRNRLMWIGFGVAGGVDLLNGLSYLFPAIPSVPVYIDLRTHINTMPWSGVGWMPVTFQPAVIGLSFLMPTDLLFSCTFFFLWWKALFVLAAATGITPGYVGGISESVFPYANEQMFGGFIAITFGSLLIGRRYFRHVLRRLVGQRSEVDDAQEGMRFRTAAVGAVVGVGLLVAFSVHAGMSLSLAVAFFAIYYLLAVAVARVRAEFGSPVHDFHFTGPDYVLSYVSGTMNLRQQDLGMFTQYWWFNRAYRGHPIAGSLEGMQMSARARSSSRAVVVAVLLATAATAIAMFWGWTHFAYKLGATGGWRYGAQWFGQEGYGRLQGWTENPEPTNFIAPIAMAVGFAISLMLTAARTAFVGWPLHPVAYALSASWSIHLVWTPMLIAWLLKTGALRYGGLAFYRRVLPFFFGLILGGSLMGCAWPLIGLIFGVPSYNSFGF
jgi:hypothetical protein